MITIPVWVAALLLLAAAGAVTVLTLVARMWRHDRAELDRLQRLHGIAPLSPAPTVAPLGTVCRQALGQYATAVAGSDLPARGHGITDPTTTPPAGLPPARAREHLTSTGIELLVAAAAVLIHTVNLGRRIRRAATRLWRWALPGGWDQAVRSWRHRPAARARRSRDRRPWSEMRLELGTAALGEYQ